jgi:hypothetical protein
MVVNGRCFYLIYNIGGEVVQASVRVSSTSTSTLASILDGVVRADTAEPRRPIPDERESMGKRWPEARAILDMLIPDFHPS